MKTTIRQTNRPSYAWSPGGRRRARSCAATTSSALTRRTDASCLARSSVRVPSPDSSCCTSAVGMRAAAASWGCVSNCRCRQSARDLADGSVMMTSPGSMPRLRTARASTSTCGDVMPSSQRRIVSTVLISDNRAKSLRLIPTRSRACRNAAGENPRRTLRLIRSGLLGSSLDTLTPPPYDSDLRAIYKSDLDAAIRGAPRGGLQVTKLLVATD